MTSNAGTTGPDGHSRYDVCVYHDHCPDGFGGAWAVRRALGERVRFIPGVSGAPVRPEAFQDLSVLLVDFCWRRADIEAVAAVARHITVVDHHETACQDLAGLSLPNLTTHFDMSRSGAMLAWRHFHGDAPPPALIRHIEDYDLFRFALDGTDEINLALTSLPFDFALWDTLDVEDLRRDGAPILRWATQQIDRIARSARRVTFAGHTVPCVNAPRCFVDRLGHKLAEGEAFAIVWAEARDRIHFSLRSREDGLVLNVIAEQYGGRGHRHAAVFSLPSSDPEAARILGHARG